MDQNCSEYILNEDYADFIMQFSPALVQRAASGELCFNMIDYINASVFMPINSLPQNIIQTYGYSVLPSCFGLMDIGSLEASGITRLRNIPAFSLLGNGVLIGIVDTGIEYTHETFRNADGTTKIISIWDQTIQDGPSPEGFYYGTEYTMEQINSALASTEPLTIVKSTDEIGHGTMLAGVAAGNRSDANNFSGVVPNSEIVVVKLKQAKRFTRDFFKIPQDAICYQENDIMIAIKYLLSVADRLMRPIAICIGIGSSQGAHDPRGILSTFISNAAAQTGVAIVVSAGNEGNSRHHFQGNIEKGTEHTTVELRVGANEPGFSMELWGTAPSAYSIDILSPTGEYIPRIPARLAESRVIRFIFEQTVINVDYQLVESQTGDQLILMRFQNPTEGIWRFRVYSTSDLTSTFHIWLPISAFLTSDTYFVEPTPQVTLTSPANTVIPITITAYDYTNRSLYLNASRGFTRTGIVSPDLAAPGVNIICPGLNNSYTTSSGTSIAAAHTAGVAAMVLQWGIVDGNYPTLDSVEIKNLLLRGAKRDPNISYPNQDWGYGILDVFNSFNSLRGDIQQ